MKWEEFVGSIDNRWMALGLVKTDIECPECGKPLYKRTDIVLSSYPPKYEYKCLSCDWSGYA